MNATLVTALLRQRLASPLRVVLLVAMWLPPIGFALLTRTFSVVTGGAWWFTLVLAAGAIGQDVSAGVLQLTFARPVTRASYVTSRWFAAAAGGFALALARLLVVALLLALRGAAPGALELGAAVLADAALAATAAAVMVLCSALVDGLGDVAVFALAMVSLQVTHLVAQMRGWAMLDRVLLELVHTLKPELSLAGLLAHGAQDWAPWVAASSTVAFALGLAIVRLNRRELSYADD